MAPEAPSPSSTSSSSESSSCNLSAGATGDPGQPTPAVDDKPSCTCSGDKSQSQDGGKSSDGLVKSGVKSSLISTRLSVDEVGAVSTPMSTAVSSAAQVQLTKNVVVVVKSTSSSSTADDVKRPAAPTRDYAEQPKKTSPGTLTLTPASVSMQCSTVVQVTTSSSGDHAGPCKVSVDKSAVVGDAKRRQQSVVSDRRVTNLRRMESSPCNLAPPAAAAGGPVVKVTAALVSDGRVTKIVPRSQPVVVKLSAPSSTPSQQVTSTGESADGESSPSEIRVPDVGAETPTSRVFGKTASRQRHCSTPVVSSPAKSISQPASSVNKAKSTVISSDISDCNKAIGETGGDNMPDVSPTTEREMQPNARRILPSMPSAEVSSDGVIGRVKKISSRVDQMCPVTSSCLASARLVRRTTVHGLTSQVAQSTPQAAGEHSGPVICDVFESLRRRQEQGTAAAARVTRDVKAPAAVGRGAAGKSRQRSARSSRPNTGRSSVASVSVKTKQAASRRPSAAAARCRKPKTPTSAASSTVGIGVRTPRRRRASRPRRNRSKSSTRMEESEVEPEVVAAGASDVTWVGETGSRFAAKCEDGIGVARLRHDSSKNDKTAGGLKDAKSSPSVRRSQASDAGTISSGLRGQVRRPACRAEYDVFCREIARVSAVDQHKRRTSTNNRQSAFAGEMSKDQQGRCEDQLSRDDGNPCFRSTLVIHTCR